MNVLALFKKITTFIFDVDGVLTDGSLLVMPGGLMVRRMNIKDGYALQLAVKQGYNVFIISGGNSPEVKERLQRLGINHCFMQVTDKATKLKEIMLEHNLHRNEILFMGDDIPDLELMLEVGLPCCPADAVTEIKEISTYISPIKGGEGCGRDVIEKTLKLQDKWMYNTHIRSK